MNENISCLKANLMNPAITQHVSEYLRPELSRGKKEITKIKWITQTVFDSIWILIWFENEKARVEWENGLSEMVRSWICRELIDEALKFVK